MIPFMVIYGTFRAFFVSNGFESEFVSPRKGVPLYQGRW
jgi:hypothetical protein